jgi:mRNA interferase RelE/StbE
VSWRVEVSKAARRDLRAVSDPAALRRLIRAIDGLEAGPFPPGVKKLAGEGEIWRLRVGDWRVCYRVDGDVLVVLVVMVGRRKDVYERLRARGL